MFLRKVLVKRNGLIKVRWNRQASPGIAAQRPWFALGAVILFGIDHLESFCWEWGRRVSYDHTKIRVLYLEGAVERYMEQIQERMRTPGQSAIKAWAARCERSPSAVVRSRARVMRLSCVSR